MGGIFGPFDILTYGSGYLEFQTGDFYCLQNACGLRSGDCCLGYALYQMVDLERLGRDGLSYRSASKMEIVSIKLFFWWKYADLNMSIRDL